jgi:hypothetical protein
MQPLYATLLSYLKQYATALGNRLWKRSVLQCYTKRLTLLCRSSICQPFMEMAGKQSSNLYATALGNRLWKRYVTACLVTYPVMQPLTLLCNRLWKRY